MFYQTKSQLNSLVFNKLLRFVFICRDPAYLFDLHTQLHLRHLKELWILTLLSLLHINLTHSLYLLHLFFHIHLAYIFLRHFHLIMADYYNTTFLDSEFKFEDDQRLLQAQAQEIAELKQIITRYKESVSVWEMLAKEQKKKARNYELERIDDVSIREMRDP